MERGLVESNFHATFTMSPLENEMSIEKNVTTADVNSSLQSTVEKSLEDVDFSFKVTDSKGADGDTYLYVDTDGTEDKEKTYSTTSGMTYTISDGESITITDGLTAGESTVTVTETVPTDCKYSFDTGYTITDVTADTDVTKNTTIVGETNNGGEGKETGNIRFTTTSDSTNALTNMLVSYENAVATNNLTISKEYKNSSGETLAATDFEFTVSIQLPDENTATARDFTYYTTDPSSTSIATNGVVTITSGSSITIPGLPVGTKVTITEKYESDRTYSATVSGTTTNTATVDISSSAATTVTFTNTKIDVSYQPSITATKSVTGTNTIPQFTFTLTNLSAAPSGYTGTETVSTVSSYTDQTAKNSTTTGEISFSKFCTFTATGTYWFSLTENSNTITDSNGTWEYDNVTYYVKYVVALNDGETACTATYYKLEGNTFSELSSGSTLTFTNTYTENTTTTYQLTITKVSSTNNDTKLSNAQFSLVGVTDTSYNQPQTTGSDGTATWTGLSAGTYTLTETAAPSGYNIDQASYTVVISDGGTATVDGKTAGVNSSTFGTTTTYTISYTVTNTPQTNLPVTGGIGIAGIVIIGIGLILAAVYLLRPSKQKKEVTPPPTAPTEAPPT